MSKKAKENEKTTNETVEQSTDSKEKMTDKKSKKQEADKSKKQRDDEKDKLLAQIEELEESIAQKDDKYLRLQAEFDNYRKRTLKEKMDLISSAGESVLKELLPFIDDFDRAMLAVAEADMDNPIVEGLRLIHKRYSDFLNKSGVVEIDAIGKDFDTDLHEAITKIPAPTDELKGKIVDVVQKGYCLNEKVIRYSKVVIGE